MIGMSDVAMMTSTYEIVVMGTPVTASEIAVRLVYKGAENMKGSTITVKRSDLPIGTAMLLGLNRDAAGKLTVIESIET